MKMKKLIIPILFLLLSSCTVNNYYQVFQTTPDNGKTKNNEIVFEDTNCKVTYDLWAEFGDMGFSIYNSSENDIVVDLTKSFFVLNGVAYEYFQNRTFSKSSNTGTTVTSYNNPYYWNVAKVAGTSSVSSSIAYMEKPQLTIPPKTSINISEYKVTRERYVDCDLEKFPSKKTIKTLKFDKSNSPFVFYNLITYITKRDTTRLENKFYVNEITNYPSSEMFSRVDTIDCGIRLEFPIFVFRNSPPENF